MRLFALLACAVGATLLAGACLETRRSLGEDCLKNDDCLSGVCLQLRCATTPRTIDTPLAADATPGDALVDSTGAMPESAGAPLDAGDLESGSGD